MAERPPPAACANCGAPLPRRARACPECGADERSGWRESTDSVYDGLDLPDSAYADEADADEADAPPARRGIAWYWSVVAALLLASLVLGLVRFR